MNRMTFDSPVAEEATAWQARLLDAAPETWADFTAWLEASPSNAAAYDKVSLLDAALGDALVLAQPVMQADNDNAPNWRGRAGRIVPAVTAIAAALVAAAVLDPMSLRHDPYSVETALGRTETVTLAGGTTIALNGGSRIRLDRRDSRVATLEHGQASFNVVHDVANPFTLRVGDAELRDVGTRFDVTRDVTGDGGRTTVAVAEGSVMYNPGRDRRLLTAGMTLAERGGRAAVGRIDPAAVGGWQAGRLVYREARLGDVVADVARATGVHIDVAPDLAQRPFSGVIVVDHDDVRMVGRLRALLGVDARQTAGGWSFTSDERAAE